MIEVESARIAGIEADAVHHDLLLIEDPIQDLQRPSAINHEILRDDLEPINGRLFAENVALVRHPQTNSSA